MLNSGRKEYFSEFLQNRFSKQACALIFAITLWYSKSNDLQSKLYRVKFFWVTCGLKFAPSFVYGEAQSFVRSWRMTSRALIFEHTFIIMAIRAALAGAVNGVRWLADFEEHWFCFKIHLTYAGSWFSILIGKHRGASEKHDSVAAGSHLECG